ncbi:unnamed protein product [Urochloa humidicola]
MAAAPQAGVGGRRRSVWPRHGSAWQRRPTGLPSDAAVDGARPRDAARRPRPRQALMAAGRRRGRDTAQRGGGGDARPRDAARRPRPRQALMAAGRQRGRDTAQRGGGGRRRPPSAGGDGTRLSWAAATTTDGASVQRGGGWSSMSRRVVAAALQAGDGGRRRPVRLRHGAAARAAGAGAQVRRRGLAASTRRSGAAGVPSSTTSWRPARALEGVVFSFFFPSCVEI